MASSPLIVSLSLLVSLPLLLPSAYAVATGVKCEEVPQDLCAFAISASGKRCVLESFMNGGTIEYRCRTTEVVATYMADWIETDGCMDACSLDRNTVGMSSDPLLDRNFLEKICTSACYDGCPNIADLYSSLGSGKGVSFKKMCKKIQNSR